MEISKIGINITGFYIENFNYPEQIRKMQEKVASQSMIGDVGKYTQVAMADSIEKGSGAGANMSNMAGTMAGMQMGMMMGQQMMNQMGGMMGQQMQPQMGQQMQPQMGQQMQPANAGAGNGTAPKFCPNCGNPTNGAKFCSNCGQQL